jgi:hypothetical protein
MQVLGRIFPDQRVRQLPSDSPIITGKGIGGFDVTHPQWRDYAVHRLGPLSNPRLMALYVDGEPRLIISGDDLSFGMLGAPAWSVIGYSPQSARRIMTNIALYAHARRVTASARPRSATAPESN